MRVLVLLLGLFVAGCSEAPRAPTYFESHPEETTRVLKACAEGHERGQECENAREGRAAIERDARTELYRRSFK